MVYHNCYICGKNSNLCSSLVSTCRCGYAHSSCLNKRRFRGCGHGNNESLYHCEGCQTDYYLVVKYPACIRNTLLYSYIVMDVLTIFALCYTILLLFSMLSYKLDFMSDSNFDKDNTVDYYLTGAILMFAFIGVIVIFIAMCSSKNENNGNGNNTSIIVLSDSSIYLVMSIVIFIGFVFYIFMIHETIREQIKYRMKCHKVDIAVKAYTVANAYEINDEEILNIPMASEYVQEIESFVK